MCDRYQTSAISAFVLILSPRISDRLPFVLTPAVASACSLSFGTVLRTFVVALGVVSGFSLAPSRLAACGAVHRRLAGARSSRIHRSHGALLRSERRPPLALASRPSRQDASPANVLRKKRSVPGFLPSARLLQSQASILINLVVFVAGVIRTRS